MIHVAGPMFAGLQRCTRCGFILTDYRGEMMVPSSQAGEPLRGFVEGCFIEVIQDGPARYSALTDDAPDCVPVQ